MEAKCQDYVLSLLWLLVLLKQDNERRPHFYPVVSSGFTPLNPAPVHASLYRQSVDLQCREDKI
jgi:hypothetical protein